VTGRNEVIVFPVAFTDDFAVAISITSHSMPVSVSEFAFVRLSIDVFEHAKVELVVLEFSLELVSIFEKIMQCKVMLMPFTSFERAIGLYTKLLDILIHQPNTQNTEFCGAFRRQTSSMVDMHLDLILKCFLDSEKRVEDCMWRCEGETAWCAFFEDATRLYWYHDYVMHIINAAKRDGYSICNVEAAEHDIRQAKGAKNTKEELTTLRAQQSFLELLKKAYKYRFQSF
jgi:hypothetical protein